MSRHNQTNTELERAFIKMIQNHERIIYKVCSFYASENFPMEDLYQETVYHLWKSFPKFQYESSLSTWMYRVALNSCISVVRKESRHQQTAPLSFLTEDIACEPDSEEEDLRELYRLIQQLKALDRAIILLWLEEKSYQEIADITGLTLSNVATKLKRIKESLKNMSNQ
jgi:RNA polymerase sigma-70 factor (ECF subfamily)